LLPLKNFYLPVGLLLFCCIIGLTYLTPRSDFYSLLLYWFDYWVLFLCILFFQKEYLVSSFKTWLTLAVLLRVTTLFALPNLSDDVYRFIWDGRLFMQGINPFNQLPSYYIENQYIIQNLDTSLFQKLNSPDYFTVYPPVCQSVFWLACSLFPNNELSSMLVMKCFLFVCELGSFYFILKLLPQQKLDKTRFFWYALNPLIILEICGNLHFEGSMICFLLGALYFLFESSNETYSPKQALRCLVLAAFFFALSVASKLLPLLFLPLLWRYLGLKKGAMFQVFVGVFCAIFFLPLLNLSVLQNMSNSLGLYFQKFEFNASLYYLLKPIGTGFYGYNPRIEIGRILSILTIIGILIFMFRQQKNDINALFNNLLFTFVLYLCCASTVHPWYLSMALALSLFTAHRFVLLWSGLIFLTYSHYNGGDFQENYLYIGIEYSVVLAFFIKCQNLSGLENPTGFSSERNCHLQNHE
jgi:alpha-1,6-mannosyltransferase